MFNPDILPRASTVVMTKEYSLLCTSMPQWLKVGHLGLLAHPKEKKFPNQAKFGPWLIIELKTPTLGIWVEMF